MRNTSSVGAEHRGNSEGKSRSKRQKVTTELLSHSDHICNVVLKL